MKKNNLPSNNRIKNVNSLRRRQSARNINKNILIICEGKRTERNYLKYLLSKLDISNVEVKPASDSKIYYILEEAEKDSDYYKFVFCLVDQDTVTNLKKYEQKAKKIKNSEKQNNVFLIMSNPCFEYWILLHFKFTRKNYDCNSSPCNQLIDGCLKKHIPDYEKKCNFENIVDKYKIAYQNAKKIQDKEGSYTDMPILIDFLENLKSNNK